MELVIPYAAAGTAPAGAKNQARWNFICISARIQSSCLAVLCVGACHIARRFNSARHRALVALCASPCLCRALSVSIPCASRLRHGTGCFGNSCIALHAARRRHLKFYVRRPVYRSMSSLGTARLSCFACATWRRSMVYALTYTPLCVFCRACVTQRPMRAVKF